jgi:microcin C transport system substrate-binding protein
MGNPKYRLWLAGIMLLFVILAETIEASPQVLTAHAVSMSGTPKYSDGFTHFDYVNPEAPKGGFLRNAAIGTFDSFNPFITKGVPANGLGLIYDQLTVQSDDEPFTQYGLVAERIEMPADRSWVIYHLNTKAKFHNGKTITAQDVVFTFDLIMTKGDPLYRKYYADVKAAEALDRQTVKFTFKDNQNPELALIVGQLQVLPKDYWEKRDFLKSTLEIPLGSGPYKIEHFKAGQSVQYVRVDNYWAKDHPVNKGRFNFDIISFDYFRDNTVSLEAFKSGEYDFRQENSSKNWATAYTGPAVEQGLIVKKEIAHQQPQGMQGFVFNTRRVIFKDAMVRQALGFAFDFEWSNKNLFYGQYTRTASYFSNSELASGGKPSRQELEILEPFRDQLPEEVYLKAYTPPATDGSGFIRKNLRQASNLLKAAGWTIQNKKRVNAQTKKPFVFEILLQDPGFERVVLPFKANLSKLGIETYIRVVDISQYINRIRTFDFDMIVFTFGQSLSPGNEQRNYWHSNAADLNGSRNLAGIKNPAIDALVELVIQAPHRQDLILRTRALDRALLWGHYVIPHWHVGYFRVAFWDKFLRPPIAPKYQLGLFTWWIDIEKEKQISDYQMR